MARYLVINDVSELKKHKPAIRSFLNLAGMGRERMVNASDVRERVFKWLKEDTAKRGKYRRIFIGEKGGELILRDKALLKYGERIVGLPYSSHYGKTKWLKLMRDELKGVSGKPRILIMDSDVGEHALTAVKMNVARRFARNYRKGSDVRVVVGAANRGALGRVDLKPDYVAHSTDANPKRLSELVEKAEGSPGTLFLTQETFRKLESAIGKVRELQAKRRMTGTLPH